MMDDKKRKEVIKCFERVDSNFIEGMKTDMLNKLDDVLRDIKNRVENEIQSIDVEYFRNKVLEKLEYGDGYSVYGLIKDTIQDILIDDYYVVGYLLFDSTYYDFMNIRKEIERLYKEREEGNG